MHPPPQILRHMATSLARFRAGEAPRRSLGYDTKSTHLGSGDGIQQCTSNAERKRSCWRVAVRAPEEAPHRPRNASDTRGRKEPRFSDCARLHHRGAAPTRRRVPSSTVAALLPDWRKPEVQPPRQRHVPARVESECRARENHPRTRQLLRRRIGTACPCARFAGAMARLCPVPAVVRWERV